MHPLNVVFLKELTDGRRDKRAVFSALLFPVLAPVLVYIMMTAIISMRTQSEAPILPVMGSEYAPGLIQYLRERGVSVQVMTDDPRAAVQDKSVELVLVIPEEFSARMAETKPAFVEIIKDGSRTDAQANIARIEGYIRAYGVEIASLRLLARGIAPQVIRTVTVESIDVASKQQRAATALNFIPLYIILAAFVSGMGIAIDATAGERERRSLEPLLINPVERFDIVAGKWLAASVFASVGMILTAVLCILAMGQVPLQELGLQFEVSWVQIMAMIIATAPIAFLATSLQLLLGSFARSFKDAQSYMGLLVMLPVVPSMLLLFNPVAVKDWMFAVPLFGQHLLLVELIGGNSVAPVGYVYSAVSCLVPGIIGVMMTARLFQKETIIRG